MAFEIKKASRQAVKPLISFYGESGCGKTYSALLAARGFVGPSGKIIIADTESGRGSLYADVLPGGYDCIDVAQPFAPSVAIEVIEAIEKSGASIGILDSGSHFWEGMGGVIDQATENEQKSGKAGLHNWRLPKIEHQRFMLRLLRSSIPWIICLRAKHKSRQIKGTAEMAEEGSIHRGQIGKTIILKDDHTSPIQAEDFLFEMTAHCEVLPDHSINLTKCSHPELRKCFPTQGPITIEHGKLIAQWCAAPGTPTSTPTPTPTTADPKRELLIELWKLAKPIRGEKTADEKTRWQGFEIWGAGQGIISETEEVAGMSPERLKELITQTKEKLPKV